MITNKYFRISTFGALYFVQGALMSYFLTFNIIYLGEAGYKETDVGIFQSILAIPFVLKLFIGMFSDGVNFFGLGHRKPYIVIGLFLQGLAMFIISQLDPKSSLMTFALIALAGSIGMALYDTCTDGMALDTTEEKDRSLVQGVMIGGRAAGILGFLLLGGFIKESAGWDWVFYSEALLPLLIIPMVLLLSEGEVTHKEKFEWSAFKSFKNFNIVLLVLMGIIYTLTIDGIYTFLSDYLKDEIKLTISRVTMFIALAMVGRIVGALTSTWTTKILGRRNSIFFAIILTTLGSIGLASGGGLVVIGIAAFFFGLAYGYYNAVYAVVAMDFSNAKIAASMFAIFMMFMNIGTVIGQSVGGALTENLGFKMMCVIMGLINIINAVFVVIMFRKKKV